MKWTTALRTLEDVADRCAHVSRQPAGIVRLRVSEAWVFGALLGPRRDDLPDADAVQVALVTNAAEEDSAAGTRPPAGGHWLAASGLETRPVVLWFRSAQAPVWNHVVDRPVRFWTEHDGLDHDVLVQLRAGDGAALRPAAPAPGELVERLGRELRVSREALRRSAVEYDDKRWSPGSPAKRGDVLADAALGYLAVADALDRAREAAAG
ncbi:hypothetical protein AB2L27_13005 [Kineococcus sp. LSe6-4]|uniref:DUF7711 domain-containing protein n=1 Tax=Kineococcus halophytocola TaxID=3234027 RepID=A0ABV4H285_9ACTN